MFYDLSGLVRRILTRMPVNKGENTNTFTGFYVYIYVIL